MKQTQQAKWDLPAVSVQDTMHPSVHEDEDDAAGGLGATCSALPLPAPRLGCSAHCARLTCRSSSGHVCLRNLHVPSMHPWFGSIFSGVMWVFSGPLKLNCFPSELSAFLNSCSWHCQFLCKIMLLIIAQTYNWCAKPDVSAQETRQV